MKYILCVIFLFISNSSANSDLTNVLTLTSNFFHNLNTFGGDLNDDTVQLIDKQIDHYIDLVKRSHGLIPKSKNKRSIFHEDIDILSTDFIGVYVLNGFFEQTRIPVRSPVDIVLFKHDFGSTEIWYAATLISSNTKNKEADRLLIFRYEDEDYIQISNVSIAKGTKISTHSSHGIIYIAVAENSAKSKVTVFLFDINENLYKVQTIIEVNPSDVAIWEHNNVIYLSIAQEVVFNTDGTYYYEAESLIFKWTGKQFENLQNINTRGARKIISFDIGDKQYLAVSNHKNNKGETEIFSEIFKYDKQTQKFKSYQQILTHAAVDIQYFCFKQKKLHENFIVVANSYEMDTNEHKNYETSSIIYKYVEDYFMPFQSFTLNYAEQWLPLVGPNGEFILLVSLKNDGVKVFQYDGWRFVESEVQYTGESFGPGIRSFRSYLYNSQPIIVVANRNDRGNMLNVFFPTFSYQNIMNEFQMDMYEWCQHITKEVVIDELKELNRVVEEAPKVDDLEIQLHGKLYFHNVTIYNLVIDDENANTRRVKKSNEASYLEKQIDKRSEQLKQLDSTLHNNGPIILNGDVRVKNLELNDDRIVFEDLHTTSINKVKLDDFFNDIINLDFPFSLHDGMEFKDVIFDGTISPKIINNIPKNALLHKDSDLPLNNNLIVHGNVIVDDLFVEGYLDGIKINENNILLTEGDQIIEGALLFSEISSDHLDVKYINNIDMINLEPNRVINITEHNIESLTVKNVSVYKINGMVMDVFHKLVLRTRGDQEITSNYEFETLIVDELIVDDEVSGTNISSLALISDSTNLILQPLYFTEDLQTKHFHVITSLNKIPVYKGRLDVLLKDYSRVQYISGNKKFESINLSGPIQLRGQIKIKGLDPPIITKNLTLNGDYTINGDTIIDKIFMFGDLADSSKIYSIGRLENEGLKLTDTEIPNHLTFNRDLNVDEIEVDTINQIEVSKWIVFESDPPTITGTKIFDEQLNINGELTILALNGDNLNTLYDNILRIDSDQYISGNHKYAKVSSIRTYSNKTYLNNIPWDNIVTLNDNQYINGTTFLSEPVKLSQFEASFAEIGKIKTYDFDELISDTAFNDTTNIVTGNKYFEDTIVFENLTADFINNASLHKLLYEINQWIGDVHIESIDINNLETTSVYFEEINGIKKNDFGHLWLLKEGEQTLHEDQFFDTLICKNIDINTQLINDINVLDFDNQAVKTTENHIFDFIHFANGVESESNIEIRGKINNIVIQDAVLTALDKQSIAGLKIFSNLTVDGTLQVNGLLSGLNITQLKKLTDFDDRKNLRLIIEGNINFDKEFNTNHLNNIDVEKLSENAWFTDQPTDLKGFISFDKILFEDDLKVDGLVDDIPLVWLSTNYFSKTKDQNITAKLDFVDGIVFGKDIEAEKAVVSGLVANISIQDFNAHILRNDDQVFDFNIEFDNVEIINEFGAHLINNLNLSTDVMRNDISENVVTAPQMIKTLNAINLDIPKGKTIQNVDVDDWFQNAVLVNGSFKIDELTIIKNAKFEKNIDLQGLLNSHLFTENHVVTTNTKQRIIGNKSFATSGYLINSSLMFDNLKLKGLFSDIDVDTLINGQIDKSKEQVHILAAKNFYNTLAASEVNVDKLYQGINVKELMKNITDLDKLNNYNEEYDRLVNFAKNILVVLKQQSQHLYTYLQTQRIKYTLEDILILEDNYLGLVSKTENSVIITLFTWDPKSDKFNEIGNIPIETTDEITFVSHILLNNKQYLYLEQESNLNPGYSHLGTMYEISTTEKNIFLFYSSTNKTNSIIGILTPNNNNCILNIQNDNFVNIFCNNKDNIFELQQQIKILNGIKASAIIIKTVPYIFIINSGPGATIQIWKYDTNKFISHQSFNISEPSSIDAIKYNNEYYIALGIKHNVEIGHPGLVVIYKYDDIQDKFKEWHKIYVIDPVNVKFTILSSDELTLQVLSNCPAEPLVIYLYEGVSGFKKKFATAELPLLKIVSNVVTNNTDFIVLSNEKEVRVIKALYTGKKYN